MKNKIKTLVRWISTRGVYKPCRGFLLNGLLALMFMFYFIYSLLHCCTGLENELTTFRARWNIGIRAGPRRILIHLFCKTCSAVSRVQCLIANYERGISVYSSASVCFLPMLFFFVYFPPFLLHIWP
jgi:hypothetical protein